MWWLQKIPDIKSRLIKLENIRSCIKVNNKPISQSAKFIIDGSVCRFMDNNESSDDEYMEVPDSVELHSSEKSSDHFEFLKYTTPPHYGDVFD